MSNTAHAIYVIEKLHQQKDHYVHVIAKIKQKEKVLDEAITQLIKEEKNCQDFNDEVERVWASFNGKYRERQERSMRLMNSDALIHFKSGDDRLAQIVNPAPKRIAKRQDQPSLHLRRQSQNRYSTSPRLGGGYGEPECRQQEPVEEIAASTPVLLSTHVVLAELVISDLGKDLGSGEDGMLAL